MKTKIKECPHCTSRWSKPFSLSEGMDLQVKQMSQWERVLQPEYYKLLVLKMQKENAARNFKPGACGHDVWRGCDIDGFVQRIANGESLQDLGLSS